MKLVVILMMMCLPSFLWADTEKKTIKSSKEELKLLYQRITMTTKPHQDAKLGEDITSNYR